MQSVKQFLGDRVKLVFLHLPLIVGYNSRKFGMTLSGRNYIMCIEQWTIEQWYHIESDFRGNLPYFMKFGGFHNERPLAMFWLLGHQFSLVFTCLRSMS